MAFADLLSGKLLGFITILDAVQIRVDPKAGTRSRRHTHDGERVVVLFDKGGQLRLSKRPEAGRIGFIVGCGGLVKQPVNLALNGAMGNQIDGAGGGQPLQSAPVALRRRSANSSGRESS